MNPAAGTGAGVSPEAPRRLSSGFVLHLAAYTLIVAAFVYLLGLGVASMGYHWQWYRVLRYVAVRTPGGLAAGPLAQGMLVTVKITSVSLGLAFAVGLLAVIMRLSASPVARALSRSYLELIRNTPLLIQIFFLYFVVSPVAGMNAFVTAVVALSLFEGAYISEIFRSGILSVPAGQWEAAHSLGLSTPETYRFVILPQAVRSVVPALAGQTVSLVKDSALVSTIAVYDLAMQAQAIVSETFLVFEVWLLVAAVYLSLTMSLSALAHALEARYKRYGI